MSNKTQDILMAIRGDNKDFRAMLEDSGKRIKRLEKIAEKTSKKVNEGFGSMSKMAKKAIGFIAAKFSVDAVKAFSKYSAKVDTVKTTFTNMVKGAGKDSEQLLKSVKTATAGTVSNLEIMKSTNLAIGLMGEDVIEKLPQMAEVARAAARLQGEEVSQMLNDIVVASGRQSVQILDNLGISSATAARYQEQYAASLGKTRQQLNDTEKKAAFFYAVQEAGKELISQVNMEQLTMTERAQVLTTQFEDMGQSLIEKSTPGLQEFINVLTTSDVGERSFVAAIGDAINDVLILLSKAVHAIKNFTTITKQKFDDAKGALTADKNTSKRILVEDMLRKSPAGASVRYMRKNREKLKSYGYSDQYLDYLQEDIRMSSQMSDERVDRKGGSSSRRKNKKGQNTTSARSDGKSWESTYLGYVGKGKDIETELAMEKAKYDKLIDQHEWSVEQKKLIDEAYNEKRKQIEDNYLQHCMQTYQNVASSALTVTSTISEYQQMKSDNENQRLDAWYQKKKQKIEQSAMDEKQKQTELEKLDEKYDKKQAKLRAKQAKREKAFAIAETLLRLPESASKAYAAMVGIPVVGPALAAMWAGVATAFQLAKVRMLQKQKVPSYQKGYNPPATTGYIPNDHHLAYVSNKEAITNAESTKANRSLLKAMNDNPGKSFERPGDVYQVTIPITVPIGNDNIYEVVSMGMENGQIFVDERSIAKR